MDIVKVSPKFQIVIPKDVRTAMKLKAGESLVIMEKEGVIHIMPVGKARELRGFARGISPGGLRDESGRFD